MNSFQSPTVSAVVACKVGNGQSSVFPCQFSSAHSLMQSNKSSGSCTRTTQKAIVGVSLGFEKVFRDDLDSLH